VAPKPWRARRAEKLLHAQPATEATFLNAADAELADARPLSGNAFKVELARRTVAAVLQQLTQEARK
jgi:xanthine dehydrogenase YagS FAD-binding subunit